MEVYFIAFSRISFLVRSLRTISQVGSPCVVSFLHVLSRVPGSHHYIVFSHFTS